MANHPANNFRFQNSVGIEFGSHALLERCHIKPVNVWPVRAMPEGAQVVSSHRWYYNRWSSAPFPQVSHHNRRENKIFKEMTNICFFIICTLPSKLTKMGVMPEMLWKRNLFCLDIVEKSLQALLLWSWLVHGLAAVSYTVYGASNEILFYIWYFLTL